MASDLLQGLRGDLGMRRIGSGMSRLDEYWAKAGRLDPSDPDAAGLLCYVAQWVDAGWRDIDVVQDGICAFPKGRRIDLPLSDYAYVLMAEGMIWVAEENVTRALANFSLVLALQAEISDPVLLALAHFWSARCNRKAGEYDSACSRYRSVQRIRREPAASARR